MIRIIAILILLAIVPTISADYDFNGFPLNTVKHETLLHGGVYIGGGHGADVTPYTETFEVPDGTIKYSRLYVGVWGGTENYVGWANIHFNGVSIVNRSLDGVMDINGDVLVSGHGVYWIVRDVKSKTHAGANTATVYTGGEIDGRVYCIVLVTAYEDASLPSVTYWINEGNMNLNYKSPTDTTQTTFDGSAPSGDMWLTTAYLTGNPDDGDTLRFNNKLVATDAADGSGPDWSLAYFDLESWDVTEHRAASDNIAKFDRGDDPYLHPVLAVLVCSNVVRTPDLVVTEIDAPRLADHDETIGAVVGHSYVVDATVKNHGNGPSNAGVARLYADGATVQSINVPALVGGESETVSFNWNPVVAKTYALKVEADATGKTTESNEGNNEKTRSVQVYSSSGQADLIKPDMTFLPTKGSDSDSTTVQVSVTNNGYKDASNFRVEYWRDGAKRSQKTVLVSAKASKVISFVDAAPLGTRNAEVKLDTTNVVSESDEGNNNEVQSFKVVTIKIICSNTANDAYATSEVFDKTKRVPEGTTPFCALESVATVNTAGVSSYVYGINGIDSSSSQMSYWYGYVNGIPVSNTASGQAGTYPLRDGEVVRWDYHKYIDGQCNMRPIMDFPEPFKHGFDGNAFATTIVRPSAYATEANDIKNHLVAAGVSNVNIVAPPAANTYLENNNLILIGTMSENTDLSSINVYHEEIGMPVYFSGGQMHDAATGNSYNEGGVVEACDNWWAGDATYDDSGPTVWIVSGVNTAYVQDAAGILTSSNLDRFWKFTFDPEWQKGDLNHDDDVADAADVTMMLQAFVGDITPNSEYDLNEDGDYADAADVTMMLQAFVGDITL